MDSPGKNGNRSTVKTLHEKEALQEDLLRIGHMFLEHRDDPLMRRLARIAILSAQERLIRG
ncbi:MAG: hypothetical protein LIQ31_05325 [Planctomycetes bacterium]|nr:hypothetical protein [Planctomycetota bacterium]